MPTTPKLEIYIDVVQSDQMFSKKIAQVCPKFVQN
jgi:hypothetical protein